MAHTAAGGASRVCGWPRGAGNLRTSDAITLVPGNLFTKDVVSLPPLHPVNYDLSSHR